MNHSLKFFELHCPEHFLTSSPSIKFHYWWKKIDPIGTVPVTFEGFCSKASQCWGAGFFGTLEL